MKARPSYVVENFRMSGWLSCCSITTRRTIRRRSSNASRRWWNYSIRLWTEAGKGLFLNDVTQFMARTSSKISLSFQIRRFCATRWLRGLEDGAGKCLAGLSRPGKGWRIWTQNRISFNRFQGASGLFNFQAKVFKDLMFFLNGKGTF